MTKWILIGLSVSFLVGFTVGAKKIFPYKPIVKTYQIIKARLAQQTTAIKNFSSCSIDEVKNIPLGSTAFIGHAYGSASKNNFIANNVSNFIEKNSHLLSSIVFTGDVFAVPSSEKWLRLGKLDRNLNIYVAPGNHDVMRADHREIFEQSIYGSINFPRIIKTSFGNVILEDSPSTKWNVSDETVRILNSKKKDIKIVARHNIPVKELIEFANSPAGLNEDLDSLDTLKTKLQSEQIIWIIGDSGVSSHFPRLKCLSSENHMFVMNGIGEIKGDTILLATDGKLYSYIIN